MSLDTPMTMDSGLGRLDYILIDMLSILGSIITKKKGGMGRGRTFDFEKSQKHNDFVLFWIDCCYNLISHLQVQRQSYL